jgi:hypothetical protein
MRRLQLGLVAFAVPMLALSLVLVGCGKPSEESGTPAPRGGGKEKQAKGKGELQPVKGEYKATLKGKVTLKGNQPDFKKLNAELAKDIEKNTDKARCLKGRQEEVTEQNYKIGENNNVADVFVWIEPAERNQFFEVSEDQLAKAKEPVVMDQPHCAFLPHCVVLFPEYVDPKTKKRVSTGQTFVIKNDAEMAHNTKYEGGTANGRDNQTLKPGTDMSLKTLKASKEKIAIACNIHTWMSAFARTYDHPYAAVTLDHDPAVKDHKDPKYFLKKDDHRYGTYEIKNVPAGAKVRVIAWHPKVEYLNGGAKGVEKTLAAGDNEQDFELEVK